MQVGGETNMAEKADGIGKPRPRLPQPYEHTALAKYLFTQIEAISSMKTQREIAAEAGYDRPNIISMFKRGEMKVPLDRVGALAKALHVDPGHMMRLALDQSYPELGPVFRSIFGHTVTDNEFAIIEVIRKASENTNPGVSTALKSQLEDIFGSK
jgi:hypothetical protein